MDPLLLLLRSNAETMSRWFHSGDRNQYKLPLLSWKNRRKHQEKMELGCGEKDSANAKRKRQPFFHFTNSFWRCWNRIIWKRLKQSTDGQNGQINTQYPKQTSSRSIYSLTVRGYVKKAKKKSFLLCFLNRISHQCLYLPFGRLVRGLRATLNEEKQTTEGR